MLSVLDSEIESLDTYMGVDFGFKILRFDICVLGTRVCIVDTWF